MSSIFSSYSQGENRVTSSILSVFRLLSLPAFEYVVSRLINEEDNLHTIRDQPSRGGEGVPDGEISARYRILIETKTSNAELGKNDLAQLNRHLDRFENNALKQALLFLTPHDEEPRIVGDIGDDRVVWKSFEDLDILLNSLLNHETMKLSEIERFLLEQLHMMIENEGLLPSKDNVVVVAAKLAWPKYQAHHVYICQPNRSFRKVDYLAFYADGAIQRPVVLISNRYPAITLDQVNDENKDLNITGTLQEQINAYAEAHREDPNMDSSFFDGAFQVFELEDEIMLEHTIGNDCTSNNSDRGVAYTQGQRYTSLEHLEEAQTTTDLIG